jgi:peptide-methionine (R)-S-oxide reductase
MPRIQKTNEEWKKELKEDVYKVTREGGTEAPFSGKYNIHKENGMYVCSNCGVKLFSSKNKFDSGSGWPSFDNIADKENVLEVEDNSHGMHRTEVICKNCGAHLGHVFKDGPQETTGLRYCINSLSLDFKEENEN